MVKTDESNPIAMAVHGGAMDIPTTEREAHRLGCRRALEVGLHILAVGGSSLEAVEAAVRVLEEDGAFDAGRGSMLDEDGQVSLDAGIMDGATLNTGSVAAVVGVPSAVSLARAVLDSPYAIIVGPGAQRFAVRHGIAVCDPSIMVSDRERARWLASGGVDRTRREAPDEIADTVGAIALDRLGHTAAATSTGGSARKPMGRVGDSPVIGAGLYADSNGAVSTSGRGEPLIPLLLAKTVVDMMGSGMSAPDASRAAIDILEKRRLRGGLISLDPSGGVGVNWNTPTMAYAFLPSGLHEIQDGPHS